MTSTIGNPASWSVDQARIIGRHLGSVTGRLGGEHEHAPPVPEVRHIEVEDLREVLKAGFADFRDFRTDVAALCIFYPAIGLVLGWFASDANLLPLVFPLMSGFALLGPVAAVGLYEMSRRHEQGIKTSWADAFSVMKSPSFGAILVLGLVLMAVFILWILTANGLYSLTLGPDAPVSIGAFVRDVFTTGPGWAMMVLGMVAGFVFAVIVLSISVVSFPLLLDHNVGLPVAIVTSIRVVAANPKPIAVWGLIVAGSLALGSLPLFLGLIVILPVLGHATWHLYRRTVSVTVPEDPAPAG